MQTAFFHNPTAGSGAHSKDALIASLRDAGLTPSYRSTKEDDGQDISAIDSELIVVAGGDGTVAKVIARLPDRRIPVVIFPLGTANNIARSLGILGAPADVAELLRHGRSRLLDIAVAQGPWGQRPFVEAAGVGVFAAAIQKDAGAKSKGMDGLRKGRRRLRELLRDAPVLDIDISADGETLAVNALGVEVLSIPYTGAALPLAPDADPGDGRFDVVCFPADRRDDMMSWLDAPHKAPPPVVTRRARKVRISGDLPHQRIDDEVFDPRPGDVTVEFTGQTARVFVPPTDSAPARPVAAQKA